MGQQERRQEHHPAVCKALAMLDTGEQLPVKGLAKAVGLSYSRLSRVFRNEMGESLVTYRNRIRVKRFLAYHDAGCLMLEAALEAGFGSYAQFHRAFHAVAGQGPAAWKRKGRPQLILDSVAELQGPANDTIAQEAAP